MKKLVAPARKQGCHRINPTTRQDEASELADNSATFSFHPPCYKNRVSNCYTTGQDVTRHDLFKRASSRSK